MQIYGLTLPKEIKDSAKALASFIDQGYVLHIDRKFYFPRSRIFTKLSKPKKLDVSNRVKALDDCVSEIIGLDDKLFFSSSSKKLTYPEVIQEYVNIDIWPIKVDDLCK